MFEKVRSDQLISVIFKRKTKIVTVFFLLILTDLLIILLH